MAQKINISGIIGWEVLASDIKKEFKSFKPNDEVDIEINSPGGSVFEGIEISNAIKNHKGKTNVVITGIAASMGSYIAMSGDTIKAHDDATFMIHNASTIEMGDHREMRKTANVLESLTNILSKSYTKQTGQSNSEIRGLMDSETWMFGDEILNAGFVDEIIQTEKPEEKEDAVAFQKLVFLDCIKQMKEEESSKNDLDKVAAYFKTQSPDSTSDKAPEKSTQVKKDKIMDEKELLALLAKTEGAVEAHEKIVAESKTDFEKASLEDVLALSESAKTEYDTAIETTKTEASKEIDSEKLTVADAKFIATIISSGNYGESVKSIGVDALCGESDLKTFKMVTAIADEQAEKIKSLQVQGDQPESTPGAGIPNQEQEDVGKTKANAQTLSDAINNSNKVQ